MTQTPAWLLSVSCHWMD